MAGEITWYLTNTLVSNHQELNRTSPGADAYASPATGWVVGTTAPTVYSEFDGGTEQANNTFSGTARPDGSINTAGDCWRTQEKLTGSFASANWTIHGVVRAQTVGGAQDGRLRYRLFRSANAAGSGATEITASAQLGATVINVSTSADFDSSLTFNPGAFSVSDEYLFIQVGWEITGAGGMSTSDINLRIGTNSTRVTSSAFTAEITGSGAIAGAEAFGTAVEAQDVAASAIAGAEAFGTAVEGQIADASGVGSAEALGSATVEVATSGDNIDPGGIDTGEAFGTAVEGQIADASGVGSAEAFGTSVEGQVADASAVTTGEAFGAAVEAQTVAASAIAGAEAFGTAAEAQAVAPAGVAGAEAFGTAAEGQHVAASGVASGETLGSASLLPITNLDPGGVATGETLGAGSLAQAIGAAGVASGEAFGSATAQLFLVAAGVASGEAAGSPAVVPIANVDPAAIAGGETFGLALYALAIGAPALASAEAFGVLQVEGTAALFVGVYNEARLYYTSTDVTTTRLDEEIEV